MKNIFLPQEINYQPDKKNKNKGSIIIEPCYPGYGITWGNGLRRVLLTSLDGAAVVSVKIKGVKYEFSSIPYVYQDVLGIILNLKSLRFFQFHYNKLNQKGFLHFLLLVQDIFLKIHLKNQAYNNH